MTTAELLDSIQRTGAVLEVNGDKLKCRLRKDAMHFAELLREHKDEVLQVLRARQETSKRQVSRWMTTRCTCPVNKQRVWVSEKSLYRDYVGWCQQHNQMPSSYYTFISIMDVFFQRDCDGWYGVCLAVDASKGRGSKPVYPLPLATERVQ